jgi:hypothetical protein
MSKGFFQRLTQHTAEHFKKHEPEIRALAAKGLEIGAFIVIGALVTALTSKEKKKDKDKS